MMMVAIMKKKTSVAHLEIFKNMGRNIPGGSFLGGNFPGVNLPGGVRLVEIFRVGIFHVGVFLVLKKIYAKNSQVYMH